MLKKTLYFLVAISTFISCTDTKSSGPCDYDEQKFNMTVIEVTEDSTQENMYVVYVDFDGNIEWANELQILSEVRDVTTDFDFIVGNGIAAGNIYTGTFYKKISGSNECEDTIVDWNQKLRN